MSFHRTNEYTNQYSRDIGSVFNLFSLPRFVFHSEGETGFWDLNDSNNLPEILTHEMKTDLLYILQSHFENTQSGEETIENVFGNYMNRYEELTIKFYGKPHNPIAIELVEEFTEGKKIATIERSYSEEPTVSEPDVKMFDWLYSVYTQDRTDLYGDKDFTISLSVRNTKDMVEFSAKADRYERNSVKSWHNETQNNGILSQTFALLS